MKILYLAPLLPAPSGSGGKRAIYNHLEDILADGAAVDAFFVDVDGVDVPDLQPFARFTPRVFGRALPKFGAGLKGKVAAISALLLNPLPRSMAVVESKQVRAAIVRELATGAVGAVIVDHLNGYAMVRGLPLSVPIVYVAHNVESEVLRQAAAQLPAWSLRRLVARLDFARMRRIEAELLARAARVVLIGAADAALPVMRNLGEKVVLWPELPQVKTPQWSHPGGKRLLFVGSAKYFPNRDAIEWLVDQLLPALLANDPAIALDIVGTAWEELRPGTAPAGVRFHGFVSDQLLDQLHREAAMFICPVVLGAGIKIKMLEASSYGLPSAATPASLAGIDFLTDIALRIERAAPDVAARDIAALLNDPACLNAQASECARALADTIGARASLLDHVRAVLPGQSPLPPAQRASVSTMQQAT